MFRLEVRSGVELRMLEDRHTDEVFAAVDANREHLRRWMPWVDSTIGPDATRQYIRKSLDQFARNEGFVAGIRVDGKFAGCIGYLPIDWTHRKVEIGYWLAQEFEGQGLMAACARVLVDHALEVWKLHRLEIRCVAGNTRSAAVASRLGFQWEGTLRQAFLLRGEYHDLHVFSMVGRS